MQYISPYGGCPGALTPHAIHFWKGPVELMLSSTWYLTLRLTVFEISAVKWPQFRPIIWNFGDRWGTAPKRREDRSGTDMYHHANFHVNRYHYHRDFCNRRKKYTPDLIWDKTHPSVAFVDIKLLRCTKLNLTTLKPDSGHVLCLWSGQETDEALYSSQV